MGELTLQLPPITLTKPRDETSAGLPVSESLDNRDEGLRRRELPGYVRNILR